MYPLCGVKIKGTVYPICGVEGKAIACPVWGVEGKGAAFPIYCIEIRVWARSCNIVRWLKAKFEVNVDTTDKSTIFFLCVAYHLSFKFLIGSTPFMPTGSHSRSAKYLQQYNLIIMYFNVYNHIEFA